MMKNIEICVDILILKEQFETLPEKVKNHLKDEYDIVSLNGSYNDQPIVMFEDCFVIYPIEHYNQIIKDISILPEDSYSIKIYEGEDSILLKSLGNFEYDPEELEIISPWYN